jgi:hypothetical protein
LNKHVFNEITHFAQPKVQHHPNSNFSFDEYHNLFRQFLQNHLNQHRRPEEIAALHSRANAWFAENDIIVDSIKHLLAVFQGEEHRAVPDAIDDESPSPPHPVPQALVETLTNRELDVNKRREAVEKAKNIGIL